MSKRCGASSLLFPTASRKARYLRRLKNSLTFFFSHQQIQLHPGMHLQVVRSALSVTTVFLLSIPACLGDTILSQPLSIGIHGCQWSSGTCLLVIHHHRCLAMSSRISNGHLCPTFNRSRREPGRLLGLTSTASRPWCSPEPHIPPRRQTLYIPRTSERKDWGCGIPLNLDIVAAHFVVCGQCRLGQAHALRQ
ncbi:hypothetical protein BS17DRAFT_442493 [Gyrodon lividus]|nr:hypothetical protein BS17DRAFT_442493 [Gyrodon lividus]